MKEIILLLANFLIKKTMNKILELLKQRRVWAGLFATIALILPLVGVNISLDANSLTDAVMKLVDAISSLLAIILPLLSYFKPKAN